MTTWNDLGALSKIAISAATLSILFIIVPPMSVLCAFVAIVSASTSLVRNRREGFGQVDLVALAVAVLVVTTIVVGTIVYGLAN